jgi:hypothetical protein
MFHFACYREGLAVRSRVIFLPLARCPKLKHINLGHAGLSGNIGKLAASEKTVTQCPLGFAAAVKHPYICNKEK